jgi:hypothetical protein
MSPKSGIKMTKPLTREFLLARGHCCHSGCRNCPYATTNEVSQKKVGEEAAEETGPFIRSTLEESKKKDTDS